MSKRVLLCDDEAPILRAAEFKLRRAGFEVECAGDGLEGWQAIERRQPDMLVTDYQMPRLNGLELVERVRKHPDTAGLPILMLTSKGLELTPDDLRRVGGVLDVLGKPFSPRELLGRIERVIGPAVDTPLVAGAAAP